LLRWEEGIKQGKCIGIPGSCTGALEHADQYIPAVNFKGGEQAGAGSVGGAGLHTPGSLTIIRRAGAEQPVGSFGGLGAAVGAGKGSLGAADSIPNQGRIQTGGGDGHQIRHAGVVIIVRIAVAVCKVGIDQTHGPGLPVHFLHKDIFCLLGRKGGISGDHPSGTDCH